MLEREKVVHTTQLQNTFNQKKRRYKIPEVHAVFTIAIHSLVHKEVTQTENTIQSI
jgi:hypothetical protein